MPTVTERDIDGYCWCTFSPAKGVLCDPDPEQDGQHVQHPVKLIETVTEFSFRDGWGDKATGDPFDAAVANLTEHSVQLYRIADEAEGACPQCGNQRSCSPQRRPVYDNVSGQAQDELLRRLRRQDKEAVALASRQADNADAQLAELRRGNDLRERELALRERELALAEARNGADTAPRARQPKATT